MDRRKVQACLPDKHIHLITEEDDAAIAGIIRENLEKYHLDIPGTAYFDPELDHLSGYYNSRPEQRAYFILTDEDGRVIGGVGIAEFPGFRHCVEIQKLYVADAWKGRGYGKLLMQTAEACARAAGFQMLYLETHSNLKAAIHMYEKYGFQLIGQPQTVVHGTMDRFYVKEISAEKIKGRYAKKHEFDD